MGGLRGKDALMGDKRDSRLVEECERVCVQDRKRETICRSC